MKTPLLAFSAFLLAVVVGAFIMLAVEGEREFALVGIVVMLILAPLLVVALRMPSKRAEKSE